eukprot:4402-Pyramimonas_sp.AAC.1
MARVALTRVWVQCPAGSCRILRLDPGLGAGSCRMLRGLADPDLDRPGSEDPRVERDTPDLRRCL